MRVARSKRITVVYNPVQVDLGRLRRAVERSVWPGAKVTWSATSAKDPGYAQASRALEEGADLIVVAGGDGTVRMVALAVSWSGANGGCGCGQRQHAGAQPRPSASV